MAGFHAAASARYPSSVVAGLLPHHCPATRISNLHLPPADYHCFTRSCIVRRRGCRAASFSRVPPPRTPAEESLDYFSDSRGGGKRCRGRPRSWLAALGTVCLSRVAVFVTPLAWSWLARSRSIARAAASDGGGRKCKDAAEESDEDDDWMPVGIQGPGPKTPIMLKEILAGKQTDSARIQLLNHVFTNVLPTEKQLQLLELVCRRAFPENHEILLNSEVFPEEWLSGDEKLEAALAVAQIYMEMDNYEGAQLVLEKLLNKADSIPSEKDFRVPLLMTVIKMTLAVKLLRSKGSTSELEEDVGRLCDLIKKSEEWSEKYRHLIEEGYTSPPKEK